jgi:outer membrane protein OmpA-like peptidoglycan-associated protein
MKKLIMTAAIMVAANVGVYAQSSSDSNTTGDKYRVVTNSFWDNWYISGAFGGAIYSGDHSSKMSFGDRLFGSAGLAFGKWFSPSIGMRIGADWYNVKCLNGNNMHPDGGLYKDTPFYKSKFASFNYHGDALFNVSEIIFGYNPERFYSCIPYASLGYIVTRKAPRANNISGSLGLLNAFRVSDAVDVNIDLRAMAFSDEFNGYDVGHKNDGIFSVSIGLTLRLGKQGWDNQIGDPNLKYSESDLNALNGRLNSLRNENSNLKNQLANGGTDTLVKKKTIVAPVMIIFDLNKSVLRKDMRINLKFFAEQVKAHSNGVTYKITGYADKETGTPERNQELSRQRADAVYNCLVNEFGFPASQLKVDYKGGVGNMYYNDPRLSRATIAVAEDE